MSLRSPTTAAAALIAAALACAAAPPATSQGKAPTRRSAARAQPKRAAAPRQARPAPTARAKDASVAFFQAGKVPRLQLRIAEAEMSRLRENDREYVRCTVIEDGKTRYEEVGVHLKGRAGSYRPLDDRPALTLNFGKFRKGQAFHGLDKIHLNNSVQDPGYLDELISSEIFLGAGIPAARTTHARVWLNGRDLGLYVLKEGFNKGFLKRHFADPSGNLYEGGFVQDIDGEVTLQNGSGPKDGRDVRALVEACREPDPDRRRRRLVKLVNVDRFLTFLALELMTCHWDGYANNRNNYRFYFEPTSGKVWFLPHGMDQMFRDPGFDVLSPRGSLVVSAVLSVPEWRERYRKRLAELVKVFAPPDRLLQRVDRHHQRLRPVLAEMGPEHAARFDERVRDLKWRLQARAEFLLRQLSAPERQPLRLAASGTAQLKQWAPRRETPNARLEVTERAGTRGAGILSIAAEPGAPCVASWRTRVVLPAGRYRFVARARAQGVQAMESPQGVGVGIRVSGSSRNNRLQGTSPWTPLAHEFRVQAPSQEVELVAELRATAGTALFDAGSMRLVRVGE